MPGIASSRDASVTIRRRQVDTCAGTVPPTINMAAPPTARRRQDSASAGCARPSPTSPPPCAVPHRRLRRFHRPESANGSAARYTRSSIASGDGAAHTYEREVAGRVKLRLAPQKLEDEL